MEKLTLPELCAIIKNDWKNMSPHAKPYFDAMVKLDNIDEYYGLDHGKNIVLYFLSNASSWRGETARNVKKQLNTMCK